MNDQNLVSLGVVSEADESALQVTFDEASFSVASVDSVSASIAVQQSLPGDGDAGVSTQATAQVSSDYLVTLTGAGHVVLANGQVLDFQMQCELEEAEQTSASVGSSATQSQGAAGSSATASQQVTLDASTLTEVSSGIAQVGLAPTNYELLRPVSNTGPVSFQAVTAIATGLIQTADGQIYGYVPPRCVPAPFDVGDNGAGSASGAEANDAAATNAGAGSADGNTTATQPTVGKSGAAATTAVGARQSASRAASSAALGLSHESASSDAMPQWNAELEQAVDLFALLNSLIGFGPQDGSRTEAASHDASAAIPADLMAAQKAGVALGQ